MGSRILENCSVPGSTIFVRNRKLNNMAKEIRRPPPPSRAFEDLKGVTAATLTATDYDELISKAFLEKTNTELLQDIALIGASKQSPGGPRAGTSTVEIHATGDTGQFAFFQPSTGEVFLLEEMTLEVDTSGSWTLAMTMEIDGETMNMIPTTSKTDTFIRMSSTFGFPTANMYLDENVKISFTLGGSFTTVTVRAWMTRYR